MARSIGLYSEAGCVLCAMTAADRGGRWGGGAKSQTPTPFRKSRSALGGQVDSMFAPRFSTLSTPLPARVCGSATVY